MFFRKLHDIQWELKAHYFSINKLIEKYVPLEKRVSKLEKEIEAKRSVSSEKNRH